MDQNFLQLLKKVQTQADKNYAKYMASQQLIKTLETEKKEYLRVHGELTKQNNEFRERITKLQYALKSSIKQKQELQSQNTSLKEVIVQLQDELRKKSSPLQQGIKVQNAENSDSGIEELFTDYTVEGKEEEQIAIAAVNKKWDRKISTTSKNGPKKRVYVEWNFVGSDGLSHAVVLSHTQDKKTKTRRILWVDTEEKYNDKSSKSSFSIELGKDTLVVTIDQKKDAYQYNLTINDLSFSDALKVWQKKQSEAQSHETAYI